MGPPGQHLSHYVLATVSEFIASYDLDRGFRFDNDDGNAGCEVARINIERHVGNCAGLSVDVKELDCEMLVAPDFDSAAGLQPTPGTRRSGRREWPTVTVKHGHGDLIMGREMSATNVE